MAARYPRDLVGYGAQPPAATWPGGARIAVQFVINYEEGGEASVLHGDPASEAFLSEVVGAQPLPGVRNMNMESMYEYGSRAGFWRLHRLFTAREVPVTVYGVAMALERNPPAVEAMLKAGWEIATHGYRWIDYQFLPEPLEREHMARAIEIHARATGSRPLGWYLGRCSPNTRRLVVEDAASSTTPTAIPTICPTGTTATAARSSSCPIRSTATTSASPCRRGSTRATSSSPISRTASTCSTPRARKRHG